MANWVYTLLIVVQVLAALGVIVLVLLQHGKGADMGAAFGSGSSGSLFGATGSANFLSRTTAVLASIFFVCTLALAFVAGKGPIRAGGGVMSTVPPAPAPGAPANTAPAASQAPTPAAPGTPASGAPATTEPRAPNEIPK